MSSNELLKRIDEVLLKAPENRHSYYQLKYFVIGKEPTIQSKMWQCLRELQSRKETIESINLQLEDSEDDLELIELNLLRETLDINSETIDTQINAIIKKENKIKIRKLERRKESLKTNINNLNKKLEFLGQEARFFIQAFESLNNMEPLKDYDDYESQKEYWDSKISEEINLRVLSKQPLTVDLMKTALSLHEDSTVKNFMLGMIEKSKLYLEKRKENEKIGNE